MREDRGVDERRLYAILAAGAAVVVGIALVDALAGDGGGDGGGAAPSSTSTSTTGAPAPADDAGAPRAMTREERETADQLAQSPARTALTVMKVVYADEGSYTADPVRLRQIEPSLSYVRGVATGAALVGAVYVETDGSGQVACVSVRSASGELFLVKSVARGATPGTWYARGATLPLRCDGEALSTSW